MEIKLNLLSEAKKIEISRKKTYRLIVLHEVMYVSIIIMYIGVLGSLYYMHSLLVKNAEIEHATAQIDSVGQEISNAQNQFKDINSQVESMKRFQSEHIVWSNMFMVMDKSIPDGVLLEKLVTTNQKIALSGRADTRDNLLKFQDNLNATECFQNAKVPLSDLFTQEKVAFQLDVEIKTSCLKPGNL